MTTLSELAGSLWTGTGELWLDPLGNQVQQCECEIEVHERGVRYTWSYEGKPHTGVITLHERGAEFSDTWHQPQPMSCKPVPGSLCLFQVQGEYGSGWGWRIALCLRPEPEQLVLQMTNIAPWGEEGRAVRMTCQR